tara:strand:- start:55 stop:240 length:186 start_codon:yes stop_codon:yes gene_type:complete
MSGGDLERSRCWAKLDTAVGDVTAAHGVRICLSTGVKLDGDAAITMQHVLVASFATLGLSA